MVLGSCYTANQVDNQVENQVDNQVEHQVENQHQLFVAEKLPTGSAMLDRLLINNCVAKIRKSVNFLCGDSGENQKIG